MSAGVRLEGLRKSYGAVEVIRGVDLDIQPEEFVVFVGPSGCGKSTLLRMIAGLEEITGGDLFIGDRRMNDVDASRRGIAMVFQTYALYPHMNVRDNMGFSLKYAGMKRDEIRRQVDEAARILGLEKLMDRRPKDLSGGQRQRVAIGRAIVRHPEVFLFDEPLSNLDAELRVQMRIEIARLHSELRSTIVYVTHDQVEAMTLADKIVVLRDGRIEQTGTPLDLYDDPDNIFVAGFIGSPKMNFLPVEAQGGALTLTEHGGQTVPMPPVGRRLEDGETATLGIRPEHFRKEGEANLEVTVEIVENLGGETYVYARQGASDILTIATGGVRGVRQGDRMTARFSPSDALLFTPDGMRIR
ncbi:ABC transporter ATP-binding protein [Wenxinia marina]|uniref:Lactose ABC transporter ATP-binding protein n=1 Tax=Wenxinia marina DSM 24838 TaxID=1123501 RepID=A0A0D0PCA9_9RHOB|nr:sn-glycerol-3-phosphate ABC transporter ATP-binding protein UgpC [Wenxinia marina]KIQ69066.1 lactose ABC transporter ATP-binding protein [Wenxinia marina DSM 24838]GGL70074.1 sugar ABC transporter ATP-binding protein [Wenxinia marina]